MAEQTLEWHDVKGFVRRRKRSFLTAFFIVFMISVVIAFILPPIYRGETTILIEDEQIPANFVPSTITSYAEERLRTIERQIFSSDRLKEIITDYDLYTDIRNKYGMGEAIIEMRDSIALETESANFINPRTGQSMAATIAFRLFFEGREPETVQKVTNVLSDLFLEEDVKMKEKITNVTTEFLKAELESLKEQIREYEEKISQFKQANFRELPEYNQVNLDTLSRLERELDKVSMEIRNLEERRIGLQGQMVTIDPLLPIQVDGEKVARNPADQLKALRLKLLSLQARLSDKHPDVIKLKSEIRMLEGQTGGSGDYQEEIKKLESLNVELAALKGRYGPKHPDVIRLTREKEALEKLINSKKDTGSRVRRMSREAPDNPMYINLKTQIATINTTIANLLSDKAEIEKDLSEYRERIENAPMVEKEYSELTRDYNATKSKYNEIMKNLMAANVARQLEEGQHGQRFEIKSYAFLPSKPYKPNRIAILLLGFVLAVGAGFSISAFQEFFDHSIKNEKELASLGMPVLTVISKVETREEKMKRFTRRVAWTAAAFGFVAVGLKLINDHVMPISDLWEVILTNAKNM